MKGIIYEIRCNETNEVYIGSTIKSIKDRMRIHMQRQNCSSMQIINRGNYAVNILEQFECSEIKDLRIRERFYFDNTNCINILRPYLAPEEKAQERKEYQALYRSAHREKNQKYQKYYRKSNEYKINEYKKEYNEANKDRIKEYNKQYYEDKIKSSG